MFVERGSVGKGGNRRRRGITMSQDRDEKGEPSRERNRLKKGDAT